MKKKTVTVYWTEFHNYSAEIEIPDNLSHESQSEEELDWVMNNTHDWGMGWHKPYEINTDWYSFYIEEIE